METLRHLFLDNPMFAEISREKNKALAEHNWQGGQLAARVLLIVIYLFLLILTLSYVQIMEPFVLMYVMLGLATVIIPSGLHGSIAGEREKRSLDMLLVAPITPAQIVIGKYGKTFLTLMLLVVAIGGPAFIIEVVKTDSEGGMGGFFRSLLLVVVTSLAMGSLTLWVSSKTRSNSASMLATIGALFIVLIVVPSIGGVISTLAPDVSDFLVYTNPFGLLYHAYAGEQSFLIQYGADASAPVRFYWWTVFGLLAFSVLFLAFATENLKNIARGRVDQ